MSKYNAKTGFIEARTTTFGNFVDPDRELVDIEHQSLVLVDLPEYARNGLGRALLGRVVRYHFSDLSAFGSEGMSIGADTSRGFLIYRDMNPVVVGKNHTEAQANSGAPEATIKALYQRKLPIELVTLGALRHAEFESVDALVADIEQYHARASWMELHPVETRFQNIEAQTGTETPFDWDRLLSAKA
jgi:hypothetical protein